MTDAQFGALTARLKVNSSQLDMIITLLEKLILVQQQQLAQRKASIV